MPVEGVVRSWDDEHGRGVIDSARTPGGCWTHYSAVAVEGHRTLVPGERVLLEFEPADQDGYAYRATRAWPHGQDPAPPPAPATEPSSAYRSTLTITFDPPDEEDPGCPPG
jgi:CspA family cold shock protein